MVKHEQVPFVTLDNKIATVDKDIYELMKLLRDLGVKTQFSCQEALASKGYVLADWKTFSRLLRQVHRFYKANAYSKQSMLEVNHFLRGMHEYGLSYFRPNSLECMSKFMFRRRKVLNRYALEYTYSNKYRGRITIRWPTENGHLIQGLLEETKQLTKSQSLQSV